jgi:hypothetical protein
MIADTTSPRRSFLGRALGGLAAFAAGSALPRLAAAEEYAPDDAWLAKIRGKHKQVFDCTSPNGGFGAAYALNYMDSHNEATGTKDSDLTAVVIFRHFAMPLVVQDGIWAKYKVGEIINVTDPNTKAASTRNIFHNAIMMRPGLTYEKMISDRGAVIVACNLALTVISGMAGQRVGVSAEEAKAEWTAGLLPGVVLAHSGVYAVNRAQEKGCTYCYGG